jgi:hypothetical protein
MFLSFALASSQPSLWFSSFASSHALLWTGLDKFGEGAMNPRYLDEGCGSSWSH